jgi:hypothetical protein
MPVTYGDKPFGLKDIKIVNGATLVSLPAALELEIKPIVDTGDLKGSDSLLGVVTRIIGAELSLKSGGIGLDALANLTGIALSTAGTTPNQISTWKPSAATSMPYVKIYGKVLGEGNDDLHCLVYKCKLTDFPSGKFENGGFFMTEAKLKAVDDGTNGVFKFVANETAAALPAS